MRMPADAASNPADAAVDALAGEYLAGLLARVPETATHHALPGHRHDALFDNGPDARLAWEAREDAWARRAGAIDPASLRERGSWVTHGMLREALEGARQARVCRTELWAVDPVYGWQTRYPALAAVQPVGDDRARDEALARFGHLPGFVDREIENLREGVRLGFTAPRTSVARVAAQIGALLAAAPARSPLCAPARRDGSPGFGAAMERLVGAEINPALARYRRFLRGEYARAARESPAVAANPGGTACYRAALRQHSTLPLEPDEVFRAGLRQVARVRAEMREAARRAFGTDDVPALLRSFREEPRHTFPTRRAMVELTRAAVARARTAMSRAFGVLPASDVVVEPFPAFQEASAPGGEYVLPSVDGTRPGVYRINTFRPRTQSRVGLESTAFHETLPGHHLQMALAMERPAGHPVTAFLWNAGFGEGWALYAERLADELGLFSGELDRMGLLSNEALRAARMVVDPGIHVRGWSRERAIAYLLRHTAESPAAAAREVDMYIAIPGMAPAYMTGSLEFFRLREKTKAELGARFDIREFHDRVLEDGSLTLPMLREKVERWIAERKAAR
jgi:uncharacterized protein (DUF885 family)